MFFIATNLNYWIIVATVINNDPTKPHGGICEEILSLKDYIILIGNGEGAVTPNLSISIVYRRFVMHNLVLA